MRACFTWRCVITTTQYYCILCSIYNNTDTVVCVCASTVQRDTDNWFQKRRGQAKRSGGRRGTADRETASRRDRRRTRGARMRTRRRRGASRCPPPARCAQRPTTSLAFFSQSGQTSTLSDSSAITMPHVIISWPPLLNQLKAGGNKALFLHRCKIMKKVRMRLAINSQDRKQHIFCVRDVLKTTLLWSSFNTSQISFHPFETWKL